MNPTISNRSSFLGLFQSTRTDSRNAMNCVMSALYARTDSLEKLLPARALRNTCCPCSSVMSSIVRLLYSVSFLLHIPKRAFIMSSDNHLFLHYPLPTPARQ